MHPAAADELTRLDEGAYRRAMAALRSLERDPWRPRPGADVRKLGDLPDGAGLHRLRVGRRRALYAVVTAAREIHVLVVAERGKRYTWLVRTAQRRRA